MEHADSVDHLSQMTTYWSWVLGPPPEPTPNPELEKEVRRKFLERYEPVVRRYLRGLLKGRPDREESVDECFQLFAFRFISGAFKGADPARGRFRDYLKRALRNLVVDLRRQKPLRPLPSEGFEPFVEDPPAPESDQEYLTIWRDELIARTLRALQAFEQQTGQQLYSVLRFRMDHPAMRSPEMAERLGAQLGKAVTPVWVRKRLFLAREKFAQLLLAEVRQSLDRPGREQLEQELIDLGLLDYCRAALGTPADPAPEKPAAKKQSGNAGSATTGCGPQTDLE